MPCGASEQKAEHHSMSVGAHKRGATEDYVMCARLPRTSAHVVLQLQLSIKVVEGMLEPTLAGSNLLLPPFPSMRQCVAEQLNCKTIGRGTTATSAGFWALHWDDSTSNLQ